MPVLAMVVRVSTWLTFGAMGFLAAHPPLKFDHFTVEQGLPQGTVNVIYQDSRGFLWIGTRSGLARYDGHDFQAFRHDPFVKDSLSDNYVKTIFEDRDHRLWIGTERGLSRMIGGRESFEHVSFSAEGGQPADVTGIVQDQRGILWIGADGGGLLKMDPDGANRNLFLHDPGDPNSLPDNKIKALYYSKTQDALWIGTGGGHLCRLDFAEERFNPIALQGSAKWEAITAIHEDRTGVLWVGTNGNGLIRIDATGEQTSFFADPEDPQSISGNHVSGIMEDLKGQFWVSTFQSGLNKMDPTHGTFTRYRYNPEDPSGLSHDRVYALFQDKAGVIWVGTLIGLNKLTPNREHFHHYKNQPGNSNSVVGNRVWSLHVDSDSFLWIGTESGLSRLDRTRGQFRGFKHDPDDLTSLVHDDISAITEDASGYLWIGTRNGLSRLDRAEFRFTSYRHSEEKTSLSDNHISSVHVDRDNRLWLGTRAGLDRLDPGTDVFIHYRHDPTNPRSLSADRAYAVLQDRFGYLWVGTPNGLNCMAPGTNDFDIYRNDPNDPHSLSHESIAPIHEDYHGDLWIGTDFGLNRLEGDRNAPKFRRFTPREGLANELIYGIQGDAQGNLWISTNQGLFKFNPATEVFRNFDIHDGLQSNEFASGAACSGPDGWLYFGGINGFNAFLPQRIETNPHPPPLALTMYQINNQKVDLKGPLSEMGDLELTHTDYIISFEFVALDFTVPSKNLYVHRLVGFDPDWSQPQTRRFASYTNLDTGDYTFQVRASNNAGVWSDPVSIGVTVIPPPWKTWWAYTLYSLALAGMVLGYTLSQKRKLAYERSVVQRLRQVDKLKDEFLANTSHELRTPLNGIIGIAESLIDGITGKLPESTTANLKMIISSGKRLTHLVNDILDFSKLSSKKLVLRLQPVDLRSLVSVVFTLSKPLIGPRNLKLVNHVPPDLAPADADEDRLQQILHNLVGNAIKFTDEGTVTVSAKANPNHLVISVVDTGIGIPREKFDSIFESFEQVDGSTSRTYGGSGLGLAITKHLVGLHGGRIWVESQPGEGAAFSFTLPISSEKAALDTRAESMVSKVQDVTPEPSIYSEKKAVAAEGDSEVSGLKPETFHILIVDDEPVNRRVLANHLTLQHFNIQEATSGAEALQHLTQNKPCDLMLLDIMMPRMSGYEVCKKIRETKTVNELPIIFLTAKNRVEDLVTGFTAGANDYLTKPVSKEELLSRVKTHLQLLDINRTLELKVSARTRELSVKNLELEEKNVAILRTQKQLVVQEKLASLGTLTAGIAHEIKNPLNFINNFAFLSRDMARELQEELETASDQFDAERFDRLQTLLNDLKQNAQIVMDNGKRADNIVQSMMALVQGKRGKRCLTDINALLNQYVDLAYHGLCGKSSKKMVTIHKDFDKSLKHLEVVPQDLGRVFINLVNNALEALLEKKNHAPDTYEPALWVRTRGENGKVVIHIRDNGKGISPRNLDQIYNPFFTTKPTGHGNIGLGLSISHEIVAQEHGGRLEVSSQEGEYTEFMIELPAG